MLSYALCYVIIEECLLKRRIKAVFWWCYMHSPNPLSNAEILKVMPTNKSISDIYHTIHEHSRLEASIRLGVMLLFGVICIIMIAYLPIFGTKIATLFCPITQIVSNFWGAVH